jgi:hypothetical protein
MTAYRLNHARALDPDQKRERRLKSLMRLCGTDVAWDTLVRVMG